MSALDDYLNLAAEYKVATDERVSDEIADRMDKIWNKKMTSADRLNYRLLHVQEQSK